MSVALAALQQLRFPMEKHSSLLIERSGLVSVVEYHGEDVLTSDMYKNLIFDLCAFATDVMAKGNFVTACRLIGLAHFASRQLVDAANVERIRGKEIFQ